jgi:hypothetical protein
MSPKFNPPPNWPTPPEGWTPPPGWQPDPQWGPAPDGWQLWVDSADPAAYGAAAATANKQGSWFGRHKVLTGVAAAAALVVVLAVANGGGSAEAEDAPAHEDTVASAPTVGGTEDIAEDKAAEKPAEKPADTTPGLNTAVRDGKFEFTVTGVETGLKSVGSGYSESAAQGQFVLVHVTVSNIGDRSQSFYDDDQKLLDSSGKQFSADSMAAIDLGAETWAKINPGNSIDTILVFDVPADMVPASIQFHDSAFSGGVKVKLS